MAGPSLYGPKQPITSGWSAASLVPKATVTATLPTPAVAAPQPAPASDLSKYNLTPKELGVTPNLRVATPQQTPLEQLLAQMFPDAAANYDPTALDPYADPRAQSNTPSLFSTILGNLGTQPSSSGSNPQVQTNPASQVAAPSIPGAPPFLAGATANLQNGWTAAPQAPVAGTNPLVALGGLASLAAEQRAQQAEQMKAQKQAETDYFQQQQQKQQAQKMVAQRQRQRFGSVNATTSGWASNPVLY